MHILNLNFKKRSHLQKNAAYISEITSGHIAQYIHRYRYVSHKINIGQLYWLTDISVRLYKTVKKKHAECMK